MRMFLGLLVLVAACFADESFKLVDSLGDTDVSRGDFNLRSLPVAPTLLNVPSFRYELPVTYAPPRAPAPVPTYAPPRPAPPPVPVYAPPRPAPPPVYAPPRPAPPPVPVYAPPRPAPPPPPAPPALPKPVYGVPALAPAPVLVPVSTAQAKGGAAVFDLTVVDSLPGDFKTKKPIFQGRTLKAGSHEYISPDGHSVSIKFH